MPTNGPWFVNHSHNLLDREGDGVLPGGIVETKKLSEFDAAIFNAIELDAEISLKEVAQDLGKSVSTLRTSLARLEEDQLIRFYPFINVFRLGYSIFIFYFNPVKAQEDALIASLQANDKVAWLARYASDDFRYCASFVCKSPLEYQRVLEDLGREHSASFYSSATLAQTALTIFKTKYLAPSRPSVGYVTLAAEGSVVQFDDTDRAILSGLLSKTYSSIRDLARQIELPHSTVNERVNSLKANGVIERFVYLADVSVWGIEIYHVTLKRRTLHPDLRKELFEFCQSEPSITVLLECFGAWDFEINVESRSREAVDAVVAEVSRRFGKLLTVVGILKREEQTKVACYPFCAPANPA